MVGIIFVGDIRFCPYLSKYEEILKNENIKYEIIFWDREPDKEKYFDKNNIHVYKRKSKLQKNPIRKIIDFIFFGRYVKKYINEKKYNKLIILSTMSGIFILDILLRKYKGKYIFDFRDLSFEHIKIFYNLEDKLIKYSNFTCISSEGFKEILPKGYNYIISHNFNNNDLLKSKKILNCTSSDSKKINISYFGFIRQYNNIKKIIDRFADDCRFNLYFHGDGPDYEKVKSYCIKNNFKNIYCTGLYTANKKQKYMLETDIINDYYSIDRNIKYATANKIYDSILYKKPVLVNKLAYDNKNVEKYGIGFSGNVEDKAFVDDLYNAYINFDFKKFNKNCDIAIKNILDDERIYVKKIKKFLRDDKE